MKTNKKEYRSPKLRRHGTVEEVTHGSGYHRAYDGRRNRRESRGS